MKPNSGATIFDVSNLSVSKAYYVNALGFELDFEIDDYLGLKLGPVQLHLSSGDPESSSIGQGRTYVFCDEVDEYHTVVSKRGALTPGTPQDMPFGLRDFQVQDPDGNRIGFGCELPD